MQRREMIDSWLNTRQPSESSTLAELLSLSREEAEYGFTRAIVTGRLEWIELFVRAIPCDVNRFAVDSETDCPLSCAIDNGQPGSLAKLLELGADPNLLISPKVGHRPLHVAVDHEFTDDEILFLEPRPTPYTELLVAKGADPLLRDFSGLSPLDWATRGDSLPMKIILEKAVASFDLKIIGLLAMADRIAASAKVDSGRRQTFLDSDIVNCDQVRLLVDLVIQHDPVEWIDDDLIRLSNWLIELGDLEGATKASLAATGGHPYRAETLLRIAILSAQGGSSPEWRNLLSLSIDSALQIRSAWIRVEPYVAAAAFLMRSGEYDWGRQLLTEARDTLAEAESCWQRNEALAKLSHSFKELSSTFEACKVTRLIDNSRLRWLTRKSLLLGRPCPKLGFFGWEDG